MHILFIVIAPSAKIDRLFWNATKEGKYEPEHDRVSSVNSYASVLRKTKKGTSYLASNKHTYPSYNLKIKESSLWLSGKTSGRNHKQ